MQQKYTHVWHLKSWAIGDSICRFSLHLKSRNLGGPWHLRNLCLVHMFRQLEQCWRTRSGRNLHAGAACCVCLVVKLFDSWSGALNCGYYSCLHFISPREFAFYHSQSHAWFSWFLFPDVPEKISTSRKWKEEVPSVGVGGFLLSIFDRSWRSNMPGHGNSGPNGLGRSFFSEGKLCIPYTPWKRMNVPWKWMVGRCNSLLKWSLFRWHVTFQGCNFWWFLSCHWECVSLWLPSKVFLSYLSWWFLFGLDPYIYIYKVVAFMIQWFKSHWRMFKKCIHLLSMMVLANFESEQKTLKNIHN